jgi:hypothetical protein
VVHNTQRPALSDRMRAKYFKVQSHRVFPGGRPAWNEARRWRLRPYDYLIWIDGSIRIISPDFAGRLIGEIEHSMAMVVHPDRDCICDEATETIAWGKYPPGPITEQVEAYRREGYPAHNGLIAGGVIARKTRAPHAARINEAWWAEQQRWTDQDQLSLPVVLWRLGTRVDVINLPLWTSGYFVREPHRFER